jgi:hypothetical protein
VIRYRVTQHDLLEAIEAAVPSWIDRAGERTAAYRVAGGYVKRSEFGNVEHDVEHFRPKAAVDEWPPASAPERADGLDFDLGDASENRGYFLLPHNPENYLISCKTCNTALKGNGFPVEGARDLGMESPRHTNERPLLAYPIGLLDDDPQALIRFEGVLPVPAARSGRRRRRGQVIISFFQLAERDGLLLERSMTIAALHLALVSIDSADALTAELAAQALRVMTSDEAAHTNCARSFVGLWADDRPSAEGFSRAALGHLRSVA